MTKTFCDRCGQELDIVTVLRLISTDKTGTPTQHAMIDACDKCIHAIRDEFKPIPKIGIKSTQFRVFGETP